VDTSRRSDRNAEARADYQGSTRRLQLLRKTLKGIQMRFSAFNGSVPGSTSQEVMDTQGKLVQLGYLLDVNGSYDAETSAAVLHFRQKWGLPIKDMIDGAFITALEMAGRPGYSAPMPAGQSDWLWWLAAAASAAWMYSRWSKRS
jgi:hypothetical protein